MVSPAVGAIPFANVESNHFELVTADAAGLRAGEKTVDLHEDLPVSFRLVCKLPTKRTPPCVGNRLREVRILHHVHDCQALGADRLVFVNQTLRDLVKVVLSGIRNPLVRLRKTLAGLLMPSASLLRAGKLLRPAAQILFRLLEMFRVRLLPAPGLDHQILEAEVDADHFVLVNFDGRLRLRLPVFVKHKRVVRARRIGRERNAL